MRKSLFVCLTALALTACGGEEYPVPATEAFSTLSSIGAPVGVSPLPVGLYGVSMDVESLPADNSVRWRFSHEGDDLGSIVAKVDPNGASSSKVTLDYAEGTAPDENWQNKNVRVMLQTAMMPLIEEAIDSRFDNRSFDTALRQQIDKNTMVANVGGMMKEASASMDKAIADQKERERDAESRAATNPYAATKPATDLSKFD